MQHFSKSLSKKEGEKNMYEKIVDLCKQQNISVSALEKKCGLGNATIQKWKDSRPNIDTLSKVAKYFGLPIEYFLAD